jgi:membrane associated rhomboid family serine protease
MKNLQTRRLQARAGAEARQARSNVWRALLNGAVLAFLLWLEWRALSGAIGSGGTKRLAYIGGLIVGVVVMGPFALVVWSASRSLLSARRPNSLS